MALLTLTISETAMTLIDVTVQVTILGSSREPVRKQKKADLSEKAFSDWLLMRGSTEKLARHACQIVQDGTVFVCVQEIGQQVKSAAATAGAAAGLHPQIAALLAQRAHDHAGDDR